MHLSPSTSTQAFTFVRHNQSAVNNAFRVSDWSGTPQRGNPREEYSPGSLAGVNSKRDPAAFEPGHAQTKRSLVVTDRNDLDGQLFQQFSSAKDLLATPVQADSRDELRAMLAERQSGGIIFTRTKFGLVKGETKHRGRFPQLHALLCKRPPALLDAIGCVK